LDRLTSIANDPRRTLDSWAAVASIEGAAGPTINAVAPPAPAPELTVTEAERPDCENTTTVVLDPSVASGCTTVDEMVCVDKRESNGSTG